MARGRPRSSEPNRRQDEVDRFDSQERRQDAAEPVDQHVPAQHGGGAERPVANASERERD